MNSTHHMGLLPSFLWKTFVPRIRIVWLCNNDLSRLCLMWHCVCVSEDTGGGGRGGWVEWGGWSQPKWNKGKHWGIVWYLQMQDPYNNGVNSQMNCNTYNFNLFFKYYYCKCFYLRYFLSTFYSVDDSTTGLFTLCSGFEKIFTDKKEHILHKDKVVGKLMMQFEGKTVSYLLIWQTLFFEQNGETSLPQFTSELLVERKHKMFCK